MQVKIERTKENKEIKFSGKASGLLEKLGIISEEVLIVVNKEIVTSDFELKDSDKVELLSVVSGG